MAARLALLVCLTVVAVGTASAQDYIGPGKCTGCHEEGKKGLASHSKTLAQLSEPKAAEYAKAVGGDAKSPKCLVCHATVVAGAPGALSCEGCHGPGKGWLAPHKKLAFYEASVPHLGMNIFYNDAKAVAKVCVDCHVLNDKAIKEAGHPLGDKFDFGGGMGKMKHWPSDSVDETRLRKYDPAFYAAVAAATGPGKAARVAAAGGPGGGKPAAGPAAGPVKPPAGGPAPAGAPTGVKPGGATVKPPKPPAAGGDDYQDLGDDEFVETRGGGAPPPPPAGAAAAPAPAAPQAPKPRPIERLDIPDETSGTYAAPPVAPPRPSAPAASAPPAAGGTPAPPAAPRAARTPTELRGQAAVMLGELIRQKKKLPLPAPAPPAEFAGPDGELLHLQDAILALALETLRKSP
jgi:hypothetical protein